MARTKRHATRRTAVPRSVQHVEELERRLQEAEETLDAIRTGAVDAFVVDGEEGERIYTLEGADRPYRVLVEHMSQGALMIAPDGTILFSNDRFARMVGSRPEALAGHSLGECVTGETDRAAFARALAEGATGTGHADFDLSCPDHSATPVHVSISPLPLTGAKVLCAIVTDLTEQRQYEELQRTQALLRDSERRKDLFLATLAQELRNPLAPLRNGLKVLEMAGDTITLDRAREMMRQQLHHMVRLIDDLLDVSRITLGKLELREHLTELAAPVQSAVRASRAAAHEAGHRLDLVLPDNVLFARADEPRLIQVLTNLIGNAVKFTPRGGRIEVRLEQENQEAVIRVRDNGAGIAPDVLPRLFDMFAPAEADPARPRTGLGIGLSIARQLVQLHGGTIEASSDGPGKGAEFTVRIPLSTEETDQRTMERAPDAPARVSTPARGAHTRILVVDHNDAGAQSLAMVLSVAGHEVRTAPDCAVGYDKAEWHRPGVAIIDLDLPGNDGPGLSRRIREQAWGRDMVIIALADAGRSSRLSDSRDAGFDHVLMKPVEPADLIALISPAVPTR